ncbi:hypothetical protein ONS95_004812 [Cadophora gregata]|uniref:uncharacterized protein n=1 Tax=Cadophora gregata TaxID=51156 RepID=UPI0026DDB61B|nr:uncharacterized protein ONS95_004812 [Cadophora gregata]KAK0104523.1 hypothetical protein ONS95_004812 [Cadophora gregata]KAK0115383.1 hypothetical protein ONS96_013840 [Cadophora gregata f. sp. sojae]
MPSATDGTVKRRACDECRGRKLACSKDPDGCERCKRENMICNYSEQKPMGRPRKRQHVEEQQTEPNPNADPFDVGIHFDSGYIDTEAEPYFTSGLPSLDQDSGAVNSSDTTPEDGRAIWSFAGSAAGPPINFGDLGLDPTNDYIPTTHSLPGLSANSSASVTDSDSSINLAGPCSCLASMYLSLAALQQLPTEIIPALLAVRSAARTASESIWCPKCGSVALDNPNPPMDAFQNTMLLGTILPIIANGYQKLLDMVDRETEIATVSGQTKTFKFNDYGGMCGKTTNLADAFTCFEKTMLFEAVEMPPQQWRTTVRAMLRIDIYGHEQPGFKHKGLRDLVSEMEFRQKTRHEMLEAHHRHGLMAADALQGKLCPGERVHTCLEVLKVAKFAIDQLVIA